MLLQRPTGVQHKAVAIKNQLIVPPDLIDVEHRASQALLGGPGQLPATFCLALAKGGGREVDQEIRLERLQLRDRIAERCAAAADFGFHPEVFAQGEPEALTAPAQQRGLITAVEIALFIKDVVTGQQTLARHQPPAVVLHQGHGIEQPPAAGFDHPQQQPKPRR